MQHAVGAPLPPHGPGSGNVGRPYQAQHPGPPPISPPPPGPGQAQPAPPPPPGQGPPPSAPGRVPPPPAPGQAPPAPGHAQPSPAPGQAPGPAWSGTGPTPPAREAVGHTGHVQLPPGGPVPLPAPPAEPGTGGATLAVLLIGPAGAGKTTVAKLWAARRRVPTAHVSLDDVREWVRSGFADPQAGWNDHSEAQYRLARRTCGFAARNFLANGISCILDDAVFPDRPVVGLGGWKRHVGPGLLPVVLLPGLEIVLERNAARSGNRRLSDEEVARIHGRMAGWYGSGLPIIDNSTYDVETTARVLDDVLARSIASPPAW
ncbi:MULTISPECIES: AAA family ATPase [unclassified Streptomyces]|uniref:AAA family ATPase n=1 Tax=unclassified Streptomyces TaxID=2593676 RepID=UPI0024A8D115|nr:MULTISPECIES: AAA family ATPase [unclassified Streptomyces]